MSDAEDSPSGTDEQEEIEENEQVEDEEEEEDDDDDGDDDESENDDDDDDGDDDDDEDGDDEDEEDSGKAKKGKKGNFGDALTKILAKPLPRTEAPALGALSKKRKPEEDLEKQEYKQQLARKVERRTKFDMCHDFCQYDQIEQNLVKVATRGVVTLFNAVAKQQKNIKKEENDDEKKEKDKRKELQNMSGKGFIDLLKSKTNPSAAAEKGSEKGAKLSAALSAEAEGTQEKAGGWKILSDNYMMGAKLRDWGVQGSEDEDEEEDDE